MCIVIWFMDFGTVYANPELEGYNGEHLGGKTCKRNLLKANQPSEISYLPFSSSVQFP